MKILITGACGFVGNAIAHHLLRSESELTIFGLDNLSRRGGETNWQSLSQAGVRLIHGDLRSASDLQHFPTWIG